MSRLVETTGSREGEKKKTLLIWDPWLRGKAKAENRVYL